MFRILSVLMNQKCTISGFTFIRNALKFDYPVVEAITSILPACDEFIVNVGNSDDDTLSLIRDIPSDKIRIIESVWDENFRTGGHVLAQQTDSALSHCTGDWCFYIQADEVVHEQYLPGIVDAAQRYYADDRVEGLLFNYLHFYGSYSYVGDSRRWYRNEIRVIRNNRNIYSYKDAQGFRIANRSLRVKPIEAYIYHYGWVKSPEIQQKKQQWFNRLWHSDAWLKSNINNTDRYDYSSIDSLKPFTGEHPAVMRNTAANQDWEFEYDRSKNNAHITIAHRILNILEKLTGYRLGEYKNYKIIK
jgi:hypothetical protein